MIWFGFLSFWKHYRVLFGIKVRYEVVTGTAVLPMFVVFWFFSVLLYLWLHGFMHLTPWLRMVLFCMFRRLRRYISVYIYTFECTFVCIYLRIKSRAITWNTYQAASCAHLRFAFHSLCVDDILHFKDLSLFYDSYVPCSWKMHQSQSVFGYGIARSMRAFALIFLFRSVLWPV